jgi:hypothetical protein
MALWKLLTGRWGDADSETDDVWIDAASGNLRTTDNEHAHIHEGDHFNYCDYALSQASAAVIEFVITTPNTTKWGHVTFEFTASAGATMQLYEGTSGVTGGTTITPRNNNRNSSTAAGLTIVKDPTSITSDGTRAAGFLAGGSRTAGLAGREKENLLKQNTVYLLRITSLAANNDISWCGEWYEHTDKNGTP